MQNGYSSEAVLEAFERKEAAKVRRSHVGLIDSYLDLLEQTLTGVILNDPGYLPGATTSDKIVADPERRRIGQDWPLHAQSMIGLVRMRNIRTCVQAVLAEDVQGDLIETGVWRGGSCIYMRAILAAYGVTDRTVWVADSFEGLPPPDPARNPSDAGDPLHAIKYLAVSLEDVQANFRKYGMLDGQVQFIKGFFEHSLPTAPVGTLAMIRLDGDMYGSTMDALNALYPKLSPGGFVIVDDYSLPPCALAVADYRAAHGVTDPLQDIDGHAVFWRKS